MTSANKTNTNKGFSLIELIISLAIFASLFLVVTATFLGIYKADKKTDALRKISDNFSFVVEDMIHNIRVGSNYHCGNTGDISQPLDCKPSSSVGSDFLAFEAKDGDTETTNDQVIYTLVDVGGRGELQKSTDGGSTFVPLSSPDVDIKNFKIYVRGSSPSDTEAAQVILSLNGIVSTSINGESTATESNIQTTITQKTIHEQICGNGIREGTEECDDGNTVTEECDYGDVSCTVCDGNCQSVAGAISYCGDWNIDWSDGEQCDDGWNNGICPAFCSISCTTNACCVCNSWSDDACGAGACSATQMRQTRTCNPAGCASESRCNDDPLCSATLNCNPGTMTLIGDLIVINENPANPIAGWSDQKFGTINNSGDDGLYELYFINANDSRDEQWNESAYLLLNNTGSTVLNSTPCFTEGKNVFITEDNDNYGEPVDPQYVGTFQINEGNNNLTVRHYCRAYKLGQCMGFHNTDWGPLGQSRCSPYDVNESVNSWEPLPAASFCIKKL